MAAPQTARLSEPPELMTVTAEEIALNEIGKTEFALEVGLASVRDLDLEHAFRRAVAG